jgi:hypothetical protein
MATEQQHANGAMSVTTDEAVSIWNEYLKLMHRPGGTQVSDLQLAINTVLANRPASYTVEQIKTALLKDHFSPGGGNREHLHRG